MPTLHANPVRTDTVGWRPSKGRGGELEIEFVVSHMPRRQAIDRIRSVARSRDDLDWLKATGDQWLIDLDGVNARFPGLLANEPWAKGVHSITADVRDEELAGVYTSTIVEFVVTEEQVRSHTMAPARDQSTVKRVFIGHGRSPLWLHLKYFLHERLHLEFEEFTRESAVGLSTKERLLQMLDTSSFAFLIMTGEDERADGSMTARLNVVHEMGLFQGRLGFECAVVLIEEGCD